MMSYCAIFGAAPQHLYEKVGWQWEADILCYGVSDDSCQKIFQHFKVHLGKKSELNGLDSIFSSKHGGSTLIHK